MLLYLSFYRMMQCISSAVHIQFIKAPLFAEQHLVGLFQEKIHRIHKEQYISCPKQKCGVRLQRNSEKSMIKTLNNKNITNPS